MVDRLGGLGPEQRELLLRWIPDAEVVADHSWGLVETVVLELNSAQGRLVAKAGGPSDRHIARELRAHREWLRPLVATGHAPELLYGDPAAKLLVTRYLPGRLLEGTPAQDDPETYRQAGELLAGYHGQSTSFDPEWHDKLRARVLRNLDLPHRIVPHIKKAVHLEASTWPGGGSRVVPTHGDWQPRNWLIDGGVVRVIDFGRADLRPPTEDFIRLARQDFSRDPRLEAAFLDGYGDDPRDPKQWRRELLSEAVGTAVWAYSVGDKEFEQLGHHQLEILVAASDTNCGGGQGTVMLRRWSRSSRVGR